MAVPKLGCARPMPLFEDIVCCSVRRRGIAVVKHDLAIVPREFKRCAESGDARTCNENLHEKEYGRVRLARQSDGLRTKRSAPPVAISSQPRISDMPPTGVSIIRLRAPVAP